MNIVYFYENFVLRKSSFRLDPVAFFFEIFLSQPPVVFPTDFN